MSGLTTVSLLDFSLTNLAAVAIAMMVVWLISVIFSDASIVDIFWGVGFVLIASLSLRVDDHTVRSVAVAVMTGVWGGRLSTHLMGRNIGKGEDPRYRAMRRRWGTRFGVVSLVTVFVLQGALMWIVSLPVQVAIFAPQPDRITWLDILGTCVWLAGFLFEAIGDVQLTRFKADPDNAGKVMDRGLWRYTRHPNYFGDALLWWGFGIISLAASPARPWALVGPLVMTVLLLRVSGVPLLERRMKRTRPGYDEYAGRTSAFIPMPPRVRAS